MKKKTAEEISSKIQQMVKEQETKTEESKKKAEEMSIKATKEETKTIREQEKSSSVTVTNKVEKAEAAVTASAATWERQIAEK